MFGLSFSKIDNTNTNTSKDITKTTIETMYNNRSEKAEDNIKFVMRKK